jgi:hypothetical protein
LKLTKTGLVDNVSYAYESAGPDPTDVALELTISDSLPLLPATIKVQGIEPELLWGYLLTVNPALARQMPRTEAALTLYATMIERYLRTQSRTERVISEVTVDSAGAPSGIVFYAAQVIKAPARRKKIH